MQFLIGLIVGLGLGGFVGVFTLSLMVASKSDTSVSEAEIQMSTNPEALEQDKVSDG